MVEAIRFVLDRHDFKAGRFSIGYQSCDDSTAQAGTYDLRTCFSNAQAYARNLDVIGVIGAYNSGCSDVQIPVANQAPDGPLAMISTSNTWNGLTRPYEGMRRGELEARYPSGERNYVRIAAADHLQSVANATLVKELGLRDLFVLSPDGDRYFTADVRTAARNLGLRIVGSANWNTEASEFTRLGRRIARTRAEAVFIAGFLDPHGGALVRDLRAQLGRDVALMAPDYFAPIPDLLSRAGPAAHGMYVSVFGVANTGASAARKAPPRGARGCLWERAELAVDRRVRRAGDRDPARRDRSLRRHALVGDTRATPDERRGRHPGKHPVRSERRPRGSPGDHLPRRRQAPAELVEPTRVSRCGRRSHDHGPRGSPSLTAGPGSSDSDDNDDRLQPAARSLR